MTPSEQVRDEEEQESLSPGGSDEDSEDDTADHDQVVSFFEPAQAPSGYKILDSCPGLETDENLQELIGTQILHALDDKDKQWDVLRDYIRDLSTVMLLCYTFYTIFPAWGPKYFRIGYVEVGGWIFTDIMLHIHENGALLGAAFPSSHVAASMIPWWYTWRYFPSHRGWMTTIWVLLCMSTVYNRYHYVVDVFAGILLSALILMFGHLLGDRARDRLRMRRFPKLRRGDKN